MSGLILKTPFDIFYLFTNMAYITELEHKHEMQYSYIFKTVHICRKYVTKNSLFFISRTCRTVDCCRKSVTDQKVSKIQMFILSITYQYSI